MADAKSFRFMSFTREMGDYCTLALLVLKPPNVVFGLRKLPEPWSDYYNALNFQGRLIWQDRGPEYTNDPKL